MIVDDVETYLQTNMSGKDVIKHFFNEDNDTQIVVRSLGGDNTIRTDIVETRLSIFTRSKTFATAKADILTAYTLLHNVSGVLATSTQIIKALGLPYLIEKDENDRFIFNFMIMVRSSAL